MADSNWTSRELVKVLIRVQGDYKSAARIIASTEKVFTAHRQAIETNVQNLELQWTREQKEELQARIEAARIDIAAHRKWEREVLDLIPHRDDLSGKASAVREVFTRTALERIRLLQTAICATDKWLKAEISVFWNLDTK